MNVLLINPPFPVSFWTLADLCKFDGSKTLAPPLGLITVAALLPQNWNLRLVDMNCREITENEWARSDIVMISCMIAQKHGMQKVIREAKQRGKIVVTGGPYPTSIPHDALDAGSDFLLQGEAENSIHLLVQALEAGEKRGIVRSKDKPPMAMSPVPRYDLLTPQDYSVMSVQTSRGCPFDCEFCDIVNLYGRKPRYKNAEQVLKELEVIYQLGWEKEVFFTDDNLIGNRSQSKAILEALIAWNEQRGKPFTYWCQASVNLGQDLEMINLMTEANIWQVFIGVESPDQEILELNQKYQNVRNPLAESLHTINKNGLGIVASFVIGFDGETPGASRRICDFVEKAGIPSVMVGTLRALPNTRLWDRLKKEGRLVENTSDGLFAEGKMNFVPTRPQSEIFAEFADVWRRLYEPRNFLDRTYRFYRTMRPTRRAIAMEKGLPLPPNISRGKVPLRRRLHSMWALLYLMWWQGIILSSRAQFWRQLLLMLRNNPSRLVKYLQTSMFGLVLLRFSKDMLKNIRNNSSRSDGDASSAHIS